MNLNILKNCLLSSFLVIILLSPAFSIAEPLDNWHWRSPLPLDDMLRAVVYGNGKFVAVGRYGKILTSTDGITWTARNSGITHDFCAVTYGNGIFVAVGEEDTILSSSDGISWTVRRADLSGNYLYGATYGNGLFVVVGSSSQIFTSPDGITWTIRQSGLTDSDYLMGITFGSDKFVAVGYSTNGGDGRITTSSDGIIWTQRTPGTFEAITGIAYGNGTYIAVGWGSLKLFSSNGIDWTMNSNSAGGYASICFGNGLFVSPGSAQGEIFTSTTGATWTKQNSSINQSLWGVAYGNRIYVAVGSAGAVVSSPNSMTWTTRNSGNSSQNTGRIYAVTYGNGKFVVSDEFGRVRTSLDGITWTLPQEAISTSYTFYIKGLTYGKGIFVAVDYFGRIGTSPDGMQWTERTSGTSKRLYKVTYENGIFVAVGGTILTSIDGITWIERNSGTSNYLRGISYLNGKFVAAGGSTIVTSSDGMSWTVTDYGLGQYGFSSVANGNNLFVIFGGKLISGIVNGIIYTSPDGLNWSEIVIGPNIELGGLIYGSGQFVSVGAFGKILTSVDGITWTARNSGITNSLNDISFGNNKFLAVGEDGVILQSDVTNTIIAPTPLYFPHVATSLLWQTEIAIINTSNQTVTGTLKGYSDNGQLVETKAVTLTARGRRQIIVADEFTNHTNIGYMIFEADSSAVQGYTKFYQTGIYRAAIPAVKDVNTSDIYISHIASDAQWWTGVSLVNTTSAAKEVTITYNNGQSVPYTFNANQHRAFMMPDAQSAVITNASGIIGLELFGSVSGGNLLEGLLLTGNTSSTLYYPHVASDNIWWTGIVAYNPSTLAGTITITPYSAAGTPLSPSTLPIGGKEKYIGVVSNLGLPAGTAWFRIDSTRPLSGFELFATHDGTQLAAYAGGGGTGAKAGVFAKIEKNGGWTGIAFVNTEATAASVTLTAYNDSGTPMATQVLPVGGHAKVVHFAEAIFTQNISGATYIAYASDRNVVGFQLNGSADGMMLDGLPALGGTN
jgi:hypothetical protein